MLGGNESPKWSGLNSDLGSSSPQPQGMPTRVCFNSYTFNIYFVLDFFRIVFSIVLTFRTHNLQIDNHHLTITTKLF